MNFPMRKSTFPSVRLFVFKVMNIYDDKKMSLACIWYTIYGKNHKCKMYPIVYRLYQRYLSLISDIMTTKMIPIVKKFWCSLSTRLLWTNLPLDWCHRNCDKKRKKSSKNQIVILISFVLSNIIVLYINLYILNFFCAENERML